MSNIPGKNEVCSEAMSCSILKEERELSTESLRAHLSEQRHDFFNLLQVLYGYTQLKKSDKVLKHITDYCRQMENLGRLYNAKCIKLADLLYTKAKEAESIDLELEINAELGFEDVVRMLDNDPVLYAVDRVLSGFYYMLDSAGCKDTVVIYSLKEMEACFVMEIYCKEAREGKLQQTGLVFPESELYWTKIERQVTGYGMITKYCEDNGFEGKMPEEAATFILTIYKGKNK